MMKHKISKEILNGRTVVGDKCTATIDISSGNLRITNGKTRYLMKGEDFLNFLRYRSFCIEHNKGRHYIEGIV